MTIIITIITLIITTGGLDYVLISDGHTWRCNLIGTLCMSFCLSFAGSGRHGLWSDQRGGENVFFFFFFENIYIYIYKYGIRNTGAKMFSWYVFARVFVTLFAFVHSVFSSQRLVWPTVITEFILFCPYKFLIPFNAKFFTGKSFMPYYWLLINWFLCWNYLFA